MNIKFILPLLFFIAFPAWLGAVEFDTSTGEEEIVLMSTDGEVNMGDSLAKSVEKQFPLVEDESVQKRVNNIGQRIAAVCDRKDIIYHFRVIDMREKDPDRPMLNAFSLPGGYVYIFKDLYDRMETDDEIASVIAHETGHIVGRHSVKRLQDAYGATLLLILGSRAQQSQGMGQASLAISSLMLHSSREDELFADKMSVKYTKKAGFDPEGAVKVLQLIWEFEKKEPIRPYAEQTHPYLSVRISKVKEEINGKMDFNDYINVPTETNR